MGKKRPNEKHLHELRSRAEKAYDENRENTKPASPDEREKLIEELRIHQIELEMQNEELRQAQRELEATRDKYLDLYDFAPDGYITIDEKGLVRDINLTGANLLGVERRHLVKTRFSRFIAPDFQDAFYLHRRRVFETKTKQACELLLKKKDGTPFYAQLESIAVPDAGGNATQLRTVVRNITDRRQRDEALQASHEFLQIANTHAEIEPLLKNFTARIKDYVGCSALGIRIIDDEGTILYQAYDGFSRQFYKSADALSFDLDPCVRFNVPEPAGDSNHPLYTNGGAFCVNSTTRFLASDGEDKERQGCSVYKRMGYESVGIIPIRSGGRVVGLIHVADHHKDKLPETKVKLLEGAASQLAVAVTRLQALSALQEAYKESLIELGGEKAKLGRAENALKGEILESELIKSELENAEDKYRAVFENALTGIAIEQDEKVIFANPRFAEIYRFPRAEIIGMDSGKLVCPEDRALVNFEKTVILAGDSRAERSESRGLTKEGNIIWVAMRCAPLKHKNRAALLINVADISPQKQGEEALKASKNELQLLAAKLMHAQEDERKRLSFEIHDSVIATLAAIKFGIENKLMLPNHLAGETLTSLKDVVNMIQECITETRRIMTNLRPSILDDLGIISTISWFCREYQNVYTAIRVEKQLAVEETEVDEDLKIVIFRVMQEAMTNAAKHSGAGRIDLALKSRAGTIELSIADNGRGFDQAPGPTPTYSRRGLGISNMRERTVLSGGSFFLESVKGKGTTIRAIWPAQAAAMT